LKSQWRELKGKLKLLEYQVVSLNRNLKLPMNKLRIEELSQLEKVKNKRRERVKDSSRNRSRLNLKWRKIKAKLNLL